MNKEQVNVIFDTTREAVRYLDDDTLEKKWMFHRDAILLCKIHDSLDRQKIIAEPALANNCQLLLQPADDLLTCRVVVPSETDMTKPAQFSIGIVTIGQIYLRKMPSSIDQLEVTSLDQIFRVLDCSRPLAKSPSETLLGYEPSRST